MADRIFSFLIWMSAALVGSVFLWILGDIVLKGFSHFSLSFLIDPPEDAGRSGGIFPIIISTALILLVAMSASVPLGLGVAVWLAEFSKRSGKAAIRNCWSCRGTEGPQFASLVGAEVSRITNCDLSGFMDGDG